MSEDEDFNKDKAGKRPEIFSGATIDPRRKRWYNHAIRPNASDIRTEIIWLWTRILPAEEKTKSREEGEKLVIHSSYLGQVFRFSSNWVC